MARSRWYLFKEAEVNFEIAAEDGNLQQRIFALMEEGRLNTLDPEIQQSVGKLSRLLESYQESFQALAKAFEKLKVDCQQESDLLVDDLVRKIMDRGYDLGC